MKSHPSTKITGGALIITLTHFALYKVAAILPTTKYIFMNEKFVFDLTFDLKFVPMGPIDNKSALGIGLVATDLDIRHP